MATYAISDIHGHFDLFQKALNIINFTGSDQLYVIGDAIDKGPDGIKLLQYIKSQGNMDLLIGNHEWLMLESINMRGLDKCTGPQRELWLFYNGGEDTFEEYKDLSKDERIELLNWLRHRLLIKQVNVAGKEFILTHSNYLPRCVNKEYLDLKETDIWRITWMSMFRFEPEVNIDNKYEQYKDLTFITGHVPVFKARWYKEAPSDAEKTLLAPFRVGNLINIDGGAAMGPEMTYYNNGLIILRLDDMQSFEFGFKEFGSVTKDG